MLQESQFTPPESRVKMVSPRDFRLSSLKGYVVNFKKDEPIWVPPHIYEEALAIGAVPVEAEAPRPEAESTVAEESRAEAAVLEQEAKTEYIQQAIMVLLARNEAGDFKADGYPKVNKVVAELRPESPRPTATEVQEVFDAMRDNMSLADD